MKSMTLQQEIIWCPYCRSLLEPTEEITNGKQIYKCQVCGYREVV